MIGLFRGAKHVVALLRIGVLLARHDALFPLEWLTFGAGFVRLTRVCFRPRAEVVGLRPGVRMALALQRLGPSYIKLGQALSTRSDLIGEEMAADLSMLQDKLPPFPSKQAIAVIEAELGQTIDQLFSTFDSIRSPPPRWRRCISRPRRTGAMSLSRYCAPGVAAAFARDLDLLLWLAERIERWRPDWQRVHPIEIVRRLHESVEFEMDLRLEAAASAELAENFKGDPWFRVPRIDWSRTAKRMLTTERIRGIPIGEKDALLAAASTRAISSANPLRPSSPWCSATASSTPICIRAICSSRRTAPSSRSISASWAGSTASIAIIWPICWWDS